MTTNEQQEMITRINAWKATLASVQGKIKLAKREVKSQELIERNVQKEILRLADKLKELTLPK